MSYKWWLILAMFLFGVGLVLGLALPVRTAEFMAEDVAALEELAGYLASLPQPLVLVIILLKNISAILISFVLSPVLCLVPVLALMVNGWLLGFISALVIEEQSLGFLLGGLLPHGIFELPAFIMGEAAALSFGAMVMVLLVRHGWSLLTSFIRKGGIRILLILVLLTIVGIFPSIIILALLNERTRPIVIGNLKQNLRYLLIALILLVPAAIIETYVTPLFLG
ncbi:hypothetical protein ES703_113315 [subsurface metagenome]